MFSTLFEQDVVRDEKVLLFVNRRVGRQSYSKDGTTALILAELNGTLVYANQLMAQVQPLADTAAGETSLQETLEQLVTFFR